MKLEFQPPDMHFNYEQQAAQRRQRRSKKFQDYYNAMKKIFDHMAIPPTEQKKFDMVFRNLRSDYKNSLLVKGVRTLRSLKVWGRKLDSANWFLYRKEPEPGTRTSQVHGVVGYVPQRGQGNSWRNWRNQESGKNSNWKDSK